jgi:hypothetical protein
VLTRLKQGLGMPGNMIDPLLALLNAFEQRVDPIERLKKWIKNVP